MFGGHHSPHYCIPAVAAHASTAGLLAYSCHVRVRRWCVLKLLRDTTLFFQSSFPGLKKTVSLMRQHTHNLVAQDEWKCGDRTCST